MNNIHRYPKDAGALHDFLRSRRSARNFRIKPLSDELIRRILRTAVHAPSAHNRQPWRFVVLRSGEKKDHLAEAMSQDYFPALVAEGESEDEARKLVRRSHERITSAPVLILLCLTMEEMDRYENPVRDQGEKIMGIQSVALAGGMLLLAAHAEGLGAVWMCAPLFVPAMIQQVLDLPRDWIPQGMILLGWPAVSPPKKSRKSIEEVARFL